MPDFDILIAGAGPAGCAAAISLADFAPELRVCLADPGLGEELRIGEAVPPPIKPILQHLGLWQRFSADGHCPSHRTVSAWGGAWLGSNEFLLHPQQVGWRLDRARFDAMLRNAAAQRAASHAAVRVEGLARADGEWRAACSDGSMRTARFVVDATGRAAALARSQGLRPVRLDRLVGCFAHLDDAGDRGDGPVIEAFRDGWWYAAAIPGGRRVVACMSDADLVRGLKLSDRDCWARALGETRHVAAMGMQGIGPLQVRPAGSQYMAVDESQPLIAVGDAASRFDPISAQGIVKALRSGIFASYAVADWLRRGDPAGLRRYRTLVQREFAAYRRTLRDYYALEQRWPDRPFWQRRTAPDAAIGRHRGPSAVTVPLPQMPAVSAAGAPVEPRGERGKTT